MESEKETAEASNKHEGEEGSPEVEEKRPIKDDTGCVEAEKMEEKEGIEEPKQETEKPVENEEMKEEVGNAGEVEEVKGEEEDEKEEEEEEVVEGKSGGDEDDVEKREDTVAEKKSVETKSRKKRTTERAELSSPRTPGTDRPTRERKTVERFTVNESARSSTPKPLAIEKGQGTQLKDIPNVAFKLSKRKADENLHLLHTILFGKKAKVHNLKKNIGLFSGFVWTENEGKQRAKVKEKLDKCVKEKLLDFCDVLNIPVNKATVKKEELLAKLLEFLESPHATSDMLLADKEKGKKRKSNDPAMKSPGSSNLAGGKHPKNQKLDSESGKKRKHSTEEENDDKSEPSQSEDEEDNDDKVPQVETDDKENDSGDGEELGVSNTQSVETSSVKRSAKKDTGRTVEKSAGKKSTANASNTPAKSTKKSSSSISKKGAANTESKSKQKATSTKRQKAEKKSEVDTSTPAKAKAASKSSTKALKKDQVVEGKSSKKAKKEPTREEMHAVVVNILKEVDFNTATLSDILRQLGNRFGVDLLHRKSEVKDIITEVIKNMSDDEDEEASESGDESGEDGGDDEA